MGREDCIRSALILSLACLLYKKLLWEETHHWCGNARRTGSLSASSLTLGLPPSIPGYVSPALPEAAPERGSLAVWRWGVQDSETGSSRKGCTVGGWKDRLSRVSVQRKLTEFAVQDTMKTPWFVLSIESSIKKTIKRAVQARCTILDAWGWCTGMTQRDGMGREEGGGFRMGNTCIPVADSFRYMAKPIQCCKVKK